MNQQVDDIPPFDDAAQEREWLRQETALRRERLNLDPAGDDERGRQYRQLSRALRESASDGLTSDFAMRVAARAAASHSASVEFVLMIVLVAALVVAAGVAVATYGGEWAPSFNAILAARNTQTSVWMMALASCLGATWLMERWQRHWHR